MATETDFAQILERLEQKIDAQGEHLGQKIDAQGEKLQSIDTRLARVEENTTNLQQENSTLREQITKQDNRVWGLLVSALTEVSKKSPISAKRMGDDSELTKQTYKFMLK